MKTKEKAGGKFRFPRRDTIYVSRRAVLGAAENGVGFLLGGVLAGAQLFGRYAPFGVAAVAAAGSGMTGFATMLGTCLGYLCLKGMTDGMRYSAAAILTYSVAFAFYDTKLFRSIWFMPAVSSLLCMVTGLICQAGTGGWLWGEDFIYFLTEVLFAGAAAYCYSGLHQGWADVIRNPQHMSGRQGAGTLVLGATVLMSLYRVSLLDTFSLGRLLAVLGVLAWGRRGAEAGALAGACTGIALDLSTGKDPYYSLIFSLAGLACGLCWRKKRLWGALAFVLANTLAMLWTWGGGGETGLFYEALAGAVIFCLLPMKKQKAPSGEAMAMELWRAPQLALGERLSRRMQETAEAFHAVYTTLRESLRPEEADTENPAEVFTRAADCVCVRCALSAMCWQREYQETRRVCNDATELIFARGRALTSDFSSRFTSRCIHFSEFVAAVNRELTGFLRKRQERNRTRQARAVLCSQYGRIEKMIRHAAAEWGSGCTPDEPRQVRLRSWMEDRGWEAWGIVCYDGEGRLRVELPVLRELKTGERHRELESLMGVYLRKPEEEEGRLIFVQAEPFRVVAAIAGRTKTGETVSGDVGTWFRREDGILFLLLCDGMGSGPEARRESGQTMKLMENFLRAGIDAEEALETVGAALSLRGELSGSSTVDLLTVDLFSGTCCIHKQGGAPSYIRRGKQVRCAAGRSLPMGVVTGAAARPDLHRFRGEGGDWILLLTDGVLCGREDDWIKTCLQSFSGSSPGELAGQVVEESQKRNGGEDDSTVLAIRLEQGEEPN